MLETFLVHNPSYETERQQWRVSVKELVVVSMRKNLEGIDVSDRQKQLNDHILQSARSSF